MKYKTTDVARILNLSPDQVAEDARKKRIKGRKHGRQWRFTREQIFAYKSLLDKEKDNDK